MKRILILVAGFAWGLLGIGCAGHNHDQLRSASNGSADQPTNTFAIYLTEEPTTSGFGTNDWRQAKLKSPPIIAASDVVAVDLTNGAIKLRRGVIKRFPDPLTDQATPLKGMPFVCVVDGERIFPGAFWTLFSSFSPSTEAVIYLDRLPGQNFLLLSWWKHEADSACPWSDPRLSACLEKLRKLGHVEYP